MTKFDARIVTRNARTNKAIDAVMKSSRTRAERNMIDRVLRSYMHILNECEVHDVDTDKVYDATTAVIATMCVEMLVRTMPKGNTTMLQGAVQTVLNEFSETFIKSVAINFDVDMQLQDPQPGAPPPLHS